MREEKSKERHRRNIRTAIEEIEDCEALERVWDTAIYWRNYLVRKESTEQNRQLDTRNKLLLRPWEWIMKRCSEARRTTFATSPPELKELLLQKVQETENPVHLDKVYRYICGLR